MSEYMETPGDMELNFDRMNYYWNFEAKTAGQTNQSDASDMALTEGRDWAQPGAQMMFVPGSDKGGVVQLTCGLGVTLSDAFVNSEGSVNFPIMVGLFQHTGFDFVDREIDTSKCRLVSAFNIRAQDYQLSSGKTYPVRLMHQWVNTDSKDRVFFVGIWMPGGRKTNGEGNDVRVQLRREVESPSSTAFTGWNLRRVDPSLDGDGYRFDSIYSPENHAHWGDVASGGSINFANAVDPTASVNSNEDTVAMPIFHGLADAYAHANL